MVPEASPMIPCSPVDSLRKSFISRQTKDSDCSRKVAPDAFLDETSVFTTTECDFCSVNATTKKEIKSQIK